MILQRAEEGSNKYSTANINWDPLETFTSGQVLEIDIVMNAFHWVRIVVREPRALILCAHLYVCWIFPPFLVVVTTTT